MPTPYLPSSLPLHQTHLPSPPPLYHQHFSSIRTHGVHHKKTQQKPLLSCSIQPRTTQINRTAEEVQHPEPNVNPRRSGRVQVRYLVERIRTVPKHDRPEFLDLLMTQRDGGIGTDDSLDLNNLLMALVLADEPDLALSSFSSMSSKGLLVPDSWTYSTMIRCYCKKGQPDEAKRVFDHMVENGLSPTVATVTELSNSYCRKGRMKGAFEVFDTMVRIGISPSVQTYNCLVKGLCYVGRVEEALEMLKGMRNGPVKPDVYTYTAVMDGFCKVGRSDEARELLEEAVGMGLSLSVVTYNTLFDGYCREGRPGKGLGMLRQMKERNCLPDCVSYRTLIHGLLKWGKARAALRVYWEMEDSGFEVDERMMNVLVRGLCRTSLKEGNGSDLLEDAGQLFSKMQIQNLAVEDDTYGLVISLFSVKKKSEEALVSVRKMMGEGFHPRIITLEDVVRGLCREGKLEKALSFLVLMEEEGMYPRRRVAYNILIEEFNRQGMAFSACNVYGIALKRGVIPEKKPKFRETEKS
ncbi:pentatricopeptide repeat-containing protein At5g41170, mitochondrial-like [Punica granatum]|uniref:PROP1-like PPR domain-containing protein n=2 Tax=Punica granatum TaxID=22663 RepID=A0A218X9P9_PUNGR|nr:pentatricopeptide repeat-containing protein At5g41170, mitochondrial-like [Punica granatum]OWM81624.1 hypothetical protein CDL15_Pgr007662 [Punica granatum]PKI40955.1 hypothetical protein CRG98_038483 [Punica granatum]